MKRQKKKAPIYRVEIEDQGDPWINHLGIMLKTIQMMSQQEREATLCFINSKYQPRVDWH